MDNLRSSEKIRGLAITKRSDREEVNVCFFKLACKNAHVANKRVQHAHACVMSVTIRWTGLLECHRTEVIAHARAWKKTPLHPHALLKRPLP